MQRKVNLWLSKLGLVSLCLAGVLLFVVNYANDVSAISTATNEKIEWQGLKPASEEGANVAYVDYEQLSGVEQQQIRSLNAQEVVKACSIYKLVYIKEGAPQPKITKPQLPKTGEHSELFYLAGISLFAVVILMLFKYRRYGMMLLLLAVGILGSQATANAYSGGSLMFEQTVAQGQVLTAPSIAGYRFVGVIEVQGHCPTPIESHISSESSSVSESESSSVSESESSSIPNIAPMETPQIIKVTRYHDTKGNTLKDEIIAKEFGEQVEIAGYQFARVEETDSVKTYIYDKIVTSIPPTAPSEPPGAIKVTRYHDTKGNTLKDEILAQKFGEQAEITGYQFVRVEETDSVKTYIYDKIVTSIPPTAPSEPPEAIKVTRYHDTKGNTLKDEIIAKEFGEQAEIPQYKFVRVEETDSVKIYIYQRLKVTRFVLVSEGTKHTMYVEIPESIFTVDNIIPAITADEFVELDKTVLDRVEAAYRTELRARTGLDIGTNYGFSYMKPIAAQAKSTFTREQKYPFYDDGDSLGFLYLYSDDSDANVGQYRHEDKSEFERVYYFHPRAYLEPTS